MSLKLIYAISKTNEIQELHLVRLLFLLNEASKRKAKKGCIDGITKLAKLDFLLRYPNCLERALTEVKANTDKANIKEYEKTTIESKMIRFKYGPWDPRYRKWIGILYSKNLAYTFLEGRTVYVGITEEGKSLIEKMSDDILFEDLNTRSSLLFKKFGTYSSTKIKDFIYQVFPEIEKMKWGEKIKL
jgi:hypothetical protein